MVDSSIGQRHSPAPRRHHARSVRNASRADTNRAHVPPALWWTAALTLLGTCSLLCWDQVRRLGDLRTHLGPFFAWFALAFLAYLSTLWVVHAIEQRGVAKGAMRGCIAVIVWMAVLLRVVMCGVTPSLSDDIYRYQWDGRVQRAGFDPYAYPPNHPQLQFLRDELFPHINFPNLRTVYPPLTELAFRAGAAMGHTVTGQKLVFVAAELLTVMALLVILWQQGRSLLWVVAYAWHPLVVLEIAGSGHNDALGIAFLWMGLAAWQAGQWMGAAVEWSLAFLSKFASVVLVPWWWFRRAHRGWLLGFLFLAALPLAMRPTAISAVIESLSVMTVRFESNASIYLAVAGLLGNAGLARLLLSACGAVWLLWWAKREADPIRYLFGAFAGAALLSPVLHPWYVLWLIPFLCLWRISALIALTGTVVLAYTVWPGYLAGGAWHVPLWARLLEYAPVLLFGLWELRRACVVPQPVRPRVVVKHAS